MIFSQEVIALLRDAIESRVCEVNTILPAVVKSYNATNQTACVVPAISRPMPTDTGGRTYEPIPELIDVPVAFPRCGEFVMHLPLQAGDFVLLVFSQFALDEFLHAGGQHEQQDPSDIRQHSLSGAVVIAGFTPNSERTQGLSATDWLLGKPGAVGVSGSASKVKIGNLAGTMKNAARKGDKVSITITPANIGTLGLSNGAGTVVAAGSCTIEGTITEGSSKVDISD